MLAFFADSSTRLIILAVFFASTIISSAFAIFIFLRFSPIAKISIVADKISEEGDIFKIRIEIQNISKVRIIKESARLSVAAIDFYSLKTLSNIADSSLLVTEWVSFSEQKFLELQSEKIKLKFENPYSILDSTFKIDPSEVKIIERLHRCKKNQLIHVGVQLRAKLNFIERIYVRSKARTDQWTSTIFYSGAINEGNSNTSRHKS